MYFDDEFDRIFRRMSRPFEDIESIFSSMRSEDGDEDVQTWGPYYYGYTIRSGPDGKPEVKEFGNVRPGLLPNSSQREPFVDQVYDENNNVVKLVAEMPGVDKKDINITIDNNTAEIQAEHGDKKYHTKVPIKYKVEENSAKATYSNGILEIQLKSLEQPAQKPKGKQVKVE